MNFITEKGDNFTTITVNVGKLNGPLAPELKGLLVEATAGKIKNIALDLSKVQYCDSSGLSALLVGNRICSKVGGTFVVCCLNDMVQKLVNISQLENVLNITPTLQEAHDFIIMEEVAKDL